MFGNIKKQLDENFGNPKEAIKNIKELSDSLKALSESLKDIDETKFKTIGSFAKMDFKQVNLILELVKELRLAGAFELLKIFLCLDKDARKDLIQITLNLVALVKSLPKDLPVGEIVSSLKELKE